MTPSVYIKGTYDTLQEKVYIKSRIEEEILLKSLVDVINEYLDIYDNSTDLLSLIYILVKRRLIEKLITKIDTDKFLDPLDI